MDSYKLTREIIKLLYNNYYKNINNDKINDIIEKNLNKRKINSLIKNLDSNFITIYELNNKKFIQLLFNNFFTKDFKPLHNKIEEEINNTMNKKFLEINKKKRKIYLEEKLKNDIAENIFDLFINMAYIFKLNNRYNIEFNDENIYNAYLSVVENNCKKQSNDLKNCLYKKKDKINIVPVSNFLGNTENKCEKSYDKFDKCIKKFIK
jgi:ERCC4-related helicase